MLHNDNELIFESYFHTITDLLNEGRGRKKQFSERVKKIITDPETGEERLETYYEMMKRLKREAALKDDDDTESDTETDTEIEQPSEVEQSEAKAEAEKAVDDTTPDEDVDIDIESSPIEDVGSFNFNTTLTLGDKYETAPRDAMTRDIISYIEDTPTTGEEIVDYLVSKGVNEVDAKNKVASLAMLDVLKLFFSDEDKISKATSKIEIPDVDTDENDSDELEDYEDVLSDLPEYSDELTDRPLGREDTEFSEEDEPVDPDELN